MCLNLTSLSTSVLNTCFYPQQGFRDNAHPGSTTSWPSMMTVGASWDQDALLAYGTAMGKEFSDKVGRVGIFDCQHYQHCHIRLSATTSLIPRSIFLCHSQGANVQLGPGACISRVPRNGRTFE